MQKTTKTQRPKRSAPMISMEQIVCNPKQPRNMSNAGPLDEMVKSIELYGIINPINVRELSEGKYQIVAGERRYKAAKLAGLTKIPCTFSDGNDQAAIALIENCVRTDLNPIEKAEAFRAIIDSGVAQKDLAAKLGLAQSTVSEVLGLLQLPKDILKECRETPVAMRKIKKIAQSKASDDEKRDQFRQVKEEMVVNRKTAADRDARRDEDIIEAAKKLAKLISEYMPTIEPTKAALVIEQLKILVPVLQRQIRKHKN